MTLSDYDGGHRLQISREATIGRLFVKERGERVFLADDATPIQTKFTIEIRERFERRLDRDFLESNSDNRSDFFTRIRPGVTVTYGKNFSAYAEYQFAHTLGITPGDKSWTTNSDARELYVRYKGPEATVTVGRQKAVMGGERLVGMG